MNSATQGDKALASSDFPGAIRYFTQALIELPRAPPYYLKRSTAFSRVKPADGGPYSQAALRDAEIALTLARERGKRELILAAQMRRGVALYQLEKYGDAGFLFEIIQGKTGAGVENVDRSEKMKDAMGKAGGAQSTSKNGYEQELPIWILKVKSKLNKLPEGDNKAAVTIPEYPSGVQVPTEKELKDQLNTLKSGKIGGSSAQSEPAAASKTVIGEASTSDGQSGAAGSTPSSAPSTAPPFDKVRHEWYQSNDTVVVTLYVKGVPKDNVDVGLNDESVSLQFPLPTGAEFDFTLDPLFASIDPSSSKVSVMSTKIEVILKKRTPGQKWGALEASAADIKLSGRETASDPTPTSSSAPSYPSSSRNGPKDWDKLASSLTAKKPKPKGKARDGEQKDSKADDTGDESDGADSVDSDFGGGDAVDAFFKKLYANADENTRRAMNKSYLESQGTSLSTNWSEVSKGKVEPRPPSD
ncbi:hypothetical protein BDV26DRAFT_266877 [Aspergillus bertholletiae]|uniref:SGT1 and CS domain protein n=1 Tax=Aspergillus bertholletiae TaxID=1226010 RepID=A0A5N7B1C7_9EURO|nr:hypothetical protein BDV26DRAFT_266877 [Aspergillus bertholletiae]